MKNLMKIAAVICGMSALPASAAVVGGLVTSGDGSFVDLTNDKPFTVGNNNFDTDNLYAFNEKQNFVLTKQLAGTLGLDSALVGTYVSSHYVFYDPKVMTHQEGYVDFDGEILGVVTTSENLASTDSLAAQGVEYLTPSLRGLEAVDVVSVDVENAQRLMVDWKAGTPGDYIRVLTASQFASVPLPAGGAFLLAGLLGFAGLRRRQK